jgi:hypothetical protein
LPLFRSSRLIRPPYTMAYIPKLESGEKLIRQFRVKLSKKAKPFLFAVSDRALYWPEQKLFTWNDPFYFRRIPHNHIQAVTLKKLGPYAFWLLSLIMILAGLAILVLVLAPLFELITGSGVNNAASKNASKLVLPIHSPSPHLRGRVAG